MEPIELVKVGALVEPVFTRKLTLAAALRLFVIVTVIAES